MAVGAAGPEGHQHAAVGERQHAHHGPPAVLEQEEAHDAGQLAGHRLDEAAGQHRRTVPAHAAREEVVEERQSVGPHLRDGVAGARGVIEHLPPLAVHAPQERSLAEPQVGAEGDVPLSRREAAEAVDGGAQLDVARAPLPRAVDGRREERLGHLRVVGERAAADGEGHRDEGVPGEEHRRAEQRQHPRDPRAPPGHQVERAQPEGGLDRPPPPQAVEGRAVGALGDEGVPGRLEPRAELLDGDPVERQPVGAQRLRAHSPSTSRAVVKRNSRKRQASRSRVTCRFR